MNVLITGGANGIGKATALQLVEREQTVTVLDHDSEALERLPDTIETLDIDVRDHEKIKDELGEQDIDVLVTCAGIQLQGSIEDQTLDDIQVHMDTNYLGTLACIKAALPSLKENNGTIVTVSSLAGMVSMPFLGAYCSSKFAVEAASDALRNELDQFGVDVAIIEPGPVVTGFNQRGLDAIRQYLHSTSYKDAYQKRLETDMFDGISAAKAAKTVVTAIEAEIPKPRYTITWQAAVLPKIAAMLPTWLQDRLLSDL